VYVSDNDGLHYGTIFQRTCQPSTGYCNEQIWSKGNYDPAGPPDACRRPVREEKHGDYLSGGRTVQARQVFQPLPNGDSAEASGSGDYEYILLPAAGITFMHASLQVTELLDKEISSRRMHLLLLI
jgi:hypothetical protein